MQYFAQEGNVAAIGQLTQGAHGLFAHVAVGIGAQLFEKGCGAAIADLTEDLRGNVLKASRARARARDERLDGGAAQLYQGKAGIEALLVIERG